MSYIRVEIFIKSAYTLLLFSKQTLGIYVIVCNECIVDNNNKLDVSEVLQHNRVKRFQECM